jgi:endoglucanase
MRMRPTHVFVAVVSLGSFHAACDVGQSSDPPSGGAGGGGGSATQSASSGAGGAGGAGGNTTSSTGSGPITSNGYYVEGNQIRRADDDAVHLFHGVDRPSLEWSASGELLSQDDFERMAGWGANVVRIAVNQAFWLHTAQYPDYQAKVDGAVQWAKAAGLDVILDLHWSDRGDNNATAAAQRMADQNSIAFWQSVAAQYKDDGGVLFELYNEPHDVPWEVWRDGGPSGDGFTAVGMQALYDAVRGAGAPNLVLIGGLNYAYDLSGVPQHRVNGYNIVYATHPYDYPGKQPSEWMTSWGSLTATDPVMVTEFGQFDCGTDYVTSLLDFADQHQVSWSAWAWFPGGCDFPALLSDWSGAPTAAGEVVKARLGSY